MTTINIACAKGCTIRGEHVTECAGKGCRGCLPRPSEHGLLCPRCWSRLVSGLADVEPMLKHLRATANALALAARVADGGRPVGDPAHRTVLHPAWLAADDLQQLVASWAQYLLEKHPMPLLGWHRAPWHGNAAAWLAPHLPHAAEQEYAPLMLGEITHTLATLHARWPTADDKERPRAIPGVRCPRCDQVSLEYAPPTWERMPFKVSCQNDDCGRVFSEDEWTRLVALIERESPRSSPPPVARPRAS